MCHLLTGQTESDFQALQKKLYSNFQTKWLNNNSAIIDLPFISKIFLKCCQAEFFMTDRKTDDRHAYFNLTLSSRKVELKVNHT